MNRIAEQSCPICEEQIHKISPEWIYRCIKCCFLQSDFISQTKLSIDETFRSKGILALREKNFRKILSLLEKIRIKKGLTDNSKRLLDVGSAHGTMLKLARQYGWSVLGIEPDEKVAMQAGAETKIGYFPEILKSDELFDVITFNDVFEHLPNPREALEACWKHLSPHGLLILNLPNSGGILYKTASFLSKLGIKTPLERLWQKDFPSPHLSYFNQRQLKLLAHQANFKSIYQTRLSSSSIRGLWYRLRFDNESPWLVSALYWVVLVTASPLFRLLPPDIILAIFERSEPADFSARK